MSFFIAFPPKIIISNVYHYNEKTGGSYLFGQFVRMMMAFLLFDVVFGKLFMRGQLNSLQKSVMIYK